MTQLTDDEVVRILEARDPDRIAIVKGENDYLHSLDAQIPLLEKLTDEEWRYLDEYLAVRFAFGRKKYMQAILTISAKDRAYAITRAIKGTVALLALSLTLLTSIGCKSISSAHCENGCENGCLLQLRPITHPEALQK